MGSDDGRLCATNTSNTELAPGCGLYSRLEREWKITRTNMNEDFNLFIKIAACGLPQTINELDLRLLVNTSDNFADGNAQCYSLSDGTGIDFIHYYTSGAIEIKDLNTTHFPNNETRYFTIASVNAATPLPVGLIEFSSNCENRNAILNWSTASETNNNYFTIEKSVDGYNYEEIATIDGQGNKNTETLYEYLDLRFSLGISYYRLSQTDFDGTKTILKTISSNCNSDFDISIHPNPTKDGVYVTLNNEKNGVFDIHVYNLLGKHISTHNIMSSTWIQLPETNGMYLLKYNIDGIEKVEKIVKQ